VGRAGTDEAADEGMGRADRKAHQDRYEVQIMAESRAAMMT